MSHYCSTAGANSPNFFLSITLISDQWFDPGWASTLHLMGGKPTGGLDSGDQDDYHADRGDYICDDNWYGNFLY